METFILNCVSALCWIPLVVLLTVLEITITFYIITILHTVSEDIPVVWQWQLINNVIICVQEGPQLFPNYEKVVQCSAESGDISASDPKSGSANTKLCVTDDTGHCGLIISGDSSGYTAFNWYWNACNFWSWFCWWFKQMTVTASI